MILGGDEIAVWGILNDVLEGRWAVSKIQYDPYPSPPAIAVMGVCPLLRFKSARPMINSRLG